MMGAVRLDPGRLKPASLHAKEVHMKQHRYDPEVLVLGLAVPVLLLLGLSGSKSAADDLSPELEFLRPFIGAWTGEFQDASERPAVLRSWTPF